jgi:hypothetical protein
MQKGNEAEMIYSNNGERWTIVAIKELADHLEITSENNWKRFAQYIGFTKNEIRTNLQVCRKLLAVKFINVIDILDFWGSIFGYDQLVQPERRLSRRICAGSCYSAQRHKT